MYRIRVKLAALPIVAIMLVGCGGGYSSLDEVIAGEGCMVESHSQAKLFATDEVHCTDGTVISWHDNRNDRDVYSTFVEGLMGRGPDVTGDSYLIFRG